jgi:hypothetical protein
VTLHDRAKTNQGSKMREGQVFANAHVVNVGTHQTVTLTGFPFGGNTHKLIYVRAIVGSPFSFAPFGTKAAHECDPTIKIVSHAITVFKESDHSVLFTWSFAENDTVGRNGVQVFSRGPQDVECDIEHMLRWKHERVLQDVLHQILDELLFERLNVDVDKLMEEPIHVDVSVMCSEM